MVKTATRGIVAFVVSVVFVLCSLWLVPDAARAVEPPPAPVEPIKTLPSTYSKVLTGVPLIDDQIYFAAHVLQQENARRAGTTLGTAVANGVPVTPSKPLLKPGAAGGVLTAAFMGGWMITDGTLAMYAKSTGTNPLQGTCGWGDFGVASVQVLYPFSSPGCGVPVANPNSDGGGDPTLSYGGSSVVVRGYSRYNNVGITDGVCLNAGGATPAGTMAEVMVYTAQNPSGSWQGVSWPTAGGAGGWCTALGGNTDRGIYSGKTYSIRLKSSTTGAVLGTMVTPSQSPGRRPRCDLKWPDGSTTTTTGTDLYNETGGVPLATFSQLCNDNFVSKPGHGPGLLPSEIKIGSTREDTGAYTEIQNAPVPDFAPSEEKGLTPGTTAGGLVLQKIVGTVVSSCMAWEVDCADWWTQTSNGTTTTTTTGDKYRCMWNGEEVTLAECSPYKTTFDTKTSTPTITDPTTGTSSPWVTAPATGSNPGAANSTSPASSINPGDACFSSWPSAADPITWVMHPVYCALLKAFAPTPAVVQAKVDEVQDKWEDTWPVKGMQAMTTVLAVVPEASGCMGPRVHFTLTWPALIEFDEHPLNACNQPYATLAAFGRIIGAMLLIGYTAWGVSRRIGAIVNAPGAGPS